MFSYVEYSIGSRVSKAGMMPKTAVYNYTLSTNNVNSFEQLFFN